MFLNIEALNKIIHESGVIIFLNKEVIFNIVFTKLLRK